MFFVLALLSKSEVLVVRTVPCQLTLCPNLSAVGIPLLAEFRQRHPFGAWISTFHPPSPSPPTKLLSCCRKSPRYLKNQNANVPVSARAPEPPTAAQVMRCLHPSETAVQLGATDVFKVLSSDGSVRLFVGPSR